MPRPAPKKMTSSFVARQRTCFNVRAIITKEFVAALEYVEQQAALLRSSTTTGHARNLNARLTGRSALTEWCIRQEPQLTSTTLTVQICSATVATEPANLRPHPPVYVRNTAHPDTAPLLPLANRLPRSVNSNSSLVASTPTLQISWRLGGVRRGMGEGGIKADARVRPPSRGSLTRDADHGV